MLQSMQTVVDQAGGIGGTVDPEDSALFAKVIYDLCLQNSLLNRVCANIFSVGFARKIYFLGIFVNHLAGGF